LVKGDKKMELTFTKSKETKGTWQFTEVVGGAGWGAVGTLYVTKDALKTMGWPQTLVVNIAAVATAGQAASGGDNGDVG
jgi:hypothetical protein